MPDVMIIGGGHVGITLLADLVNTAKLHQKKVALVLFGGRDQDIGTRIRPWLNPLTMSSIIDGSETEVQLTADHFMALDSPQTMRGLAAARHIVITVPDIPALRMPLLSRLLGEIDLSGKTLLLVRAGQAGQPVVAEFVRTRRELEHTSVVLVEDSFYGTRVDAGNRINYKRKLAVNVAVYSRDATRVMRDLRELFPLGAAIGQQSWPEFVVRDGVEILFDPLGYIIHTAVALAERNLSRTRAGIRYTHYIDGIDQELAHRVQLLDRERVALASAFGVQAETYPQIIERQYGVPAVDDYYEMLQSCSGIYKSLSHGSIDALKRSRFVLEDIPPLYTMEWLANSAGVDIPHTRSFAESVWKTTASLGLEPASFGGYRPTLSDIKSEPQYIRDLLNTPHGLT
ncbi:MULTISPECIES: NAD/NADP octopine/nopaline dehydrogenase family protein [unclassified Streptomyces]|uniref:NAD/NADP octopine/nopaline dehydrogenase family protein n=1 Tax=unclassified Streptomyces TaxID=2593676 RepID=UPI0029B23443|nr:MULTISPECIES: NAD/NADP octopine/nopaline dehydrogenase family protein [unclassified Streptomyces]MDX3767887.1 NAD/NADP octopine/nopaline dehydrogenase family protein [Streptomyces sp. AK08-01B]MDX3818114.1 NAD/NADP octopine/nopaline dehydrogenase family protein [Streptomyces sp. AK08-01A]